LLGAEAANDHAREQARIVLSGMAGDAGPLVRLAGDDGADHVLPIEVVSSELPSQFVEQFGVVGWIVGTLLVHWIGQAGAEEIGPKAIDGGASEVEIFGAHEPVGQNVARMVARLSGRLGSGEEAGADDSFLAGDYNLSFIQHFAPLRLAFSGSATSIWATLADWLRRIEGESPAHQRSQKPAPQAAVETL
jgi:hypothetical protein